MSYDLREPHDGAADAELADVRQWYFGCLTAVQKKIGKSPRSPSPEMVEQFSATRSIGMWVNFLDPLHKQYRHRPALIERGRLTWGRLAQANELLFQPGRQDLPASVIYPVTKPDPDDPLRLAHAASRMWGAKHGPRDADTKQLGALMEDEYARGMGVELPPGLTGGKPCRHSAIQIHRKHLPQGRLMGMLLPLLILPEETSAVIAVPGAFWPPQLVRAWGHGDLA